MLKFIVLLLAVCNLALASEEITKKYPPYPDTWGYDLSEYQAARINEFGVSDYKIDNGDYWFEFTSFILKNKLDDTHLDDQNIYRILKSKFSLIKFFGNEIYQDYAELDFTKLNSKYEYHNKAINEQITKHTVCEKSPNLTFYHNKITFSNGHTLERVYDDDIPLKQCWWDGLAALYYVRKDEKGNELGRYSIITVGSNPSKLLSLDSDDYIETCGDPNAKYVYEQIFSFYGKMLLLEDDTFILSGDNNVIVRFKEDLTTPFAPAVNYLMYNGKVLKRNFYVIPYEVIGKIITQKRLAEIPIRQGLQDGLIEYLAENY